jgi:putative transferase (TIGR04331 family)
MTRFLITTADERSWVFDRPVLFLGEWCRLYDRKQAWEGMDAIVAEPFGVQKGIKSQHNAYLSALTSNLLMELTDVLNSYHRTSHDSRYWNILLGRWLQRYVITIFNRYCTLEQALDKYDVGGTIIFEHSGYSLATVDSLSFIYAEQNDIWNHVLYSRILAYLGKIEVSVEHEPLRKIGGFSQEKESKTTSRKNFRYLMRLVANKILPKFGRDTDALIINSYLPKLEEVKLQLSLGQLPQFWQSPSHHNVPVDRILRQKISMNVSQHKGFECFVRTLLPEVIPSCFLEGYQQVVEQAEALPWPAKPKFIFTSNNFDTDELFKAWVGSKIEEGCAYFVGQHGNHYSTRLDSPYWPEVVTCDKFFSWGWSDDNSRIVPAFIFKLAGRKKIRADAAGGLLLIESPPPIRLEAEDSYYQYGIYQEDQFSFAHALHDDIQQKMIVRLHGIYRKMHWCDEQRWKDRCPNLFVETGTKKLNDLISASRLIVHSYDSTGILETLALNIPTLAFWRNDFEHLTEGAKPYYQLLVNAGILHFSPESMAAKVNEVWNDVAGWWMQPSVQEAKNLFCNRYARVSQNPVCELKTILLSKNL